MFNVEEAKQKLMKEYDSAFEVALNGCIHKDKNLQNTGIHDAYLIAHIMRELFDDDFLIKQCTWWKDS